MWASLDDITANWALDAELAPGPDRDAADEAHARWSRAVDRSRHWIDPSPT